MHFKKLVLSCNKNHEWGEKYPQDEGLIALREIITTERTINKSLANLEVITWFMLIKLTTSTTQRINFQIRWFSWA